MNENKTNINWYPGHMAKTKREIKEQIDLVDVVVLVLDARVPRSSYVKDIDEFTNNKDKIIVFSKYDLCDKERTLMWETYYKDHGYTVLKSTLESSSIKNELIEAVSKSLEKINQKRKEKGLLPKKARVMIVGSSNVGKSTLINKIANRKAATTGNIPGVTKNISTIKINDKIDLLDTPGVLWPKFDSEEEALNLAAMSIIKEEVVPLDKVAIHIMLKLNQKYKPILKKELGLDSFNLDDIEEEYETISKYKNLPKVGGEVDYDKINLLIINLIKNEQIKYITFD